MGDLFTRLGQLFLQSVPTVIFVFLLLVILDRLFFRRINDILQERENLTLGALARAREQTALAESRVREYEAAFQAVRHEVYRQREADRRQAIAEREEALRKARQEADSWLAAAQADLSRQVEGVKAELGSACQLLATEITDKVLRADTSGDANSGRRS